MVERERSGDAASDTVASDVAASSRGRGERNGDPVRRRLAQAGAAVMLALLMLPPGSVLGADAVTSWHVPVLMYHRVAPDSDLRTSIRDLVVRPRLFRAQMRALHAAGWSTITAAALAQAMKDRVALPHRVVVISFDDGTQDSFTNAWPVMRRHGFVGTFYVITSRLHPDNHPWSYSMSQLQARQLAAEGNEIANHTRHHICLAGTAESLATSEIQGGSSDITSITGARPVTLAWPKGCVDATSVAAARGGATFLAFTTIPGCHETLRDRLTTPRIRVHRSTQPRALLRLLAPCR